MSLDANLTKSATLQVVGKIFSTLIGFVSIILMIKYLDKDVFGWYSTASYFLQFFGIVADFGFIVVGTNMLSEPDYDREKLTNTLFGWRLATALIIQGSAPLIYLIFSDHGPTSTAVMILSFAFFLTSVNQVFISRFQSEHRNYLQVVGEILGRLALLIGTVATVNLGLGFIPLVILISVSNIFYTGFLWLKHPTIRISFDKDISKALFHRMWPTALAVICNAVYLQGDKVILPFYISDIEVADYTSAYRVVDILTQTSALLMGIFLPFITYHWSRNKKEEFAAYYRLSIETVALFLFPAIGLLTILGVPLMTFIRADYAPAGHILRVLIWTVVGIWLGMVFGHIILALKKQKTALLVYGSNALLSLVGYFILIPRYGVWGGVMISIGAEFFTGIILAALCTYYTKVVPRAMPLVKIFLATTLMSWAVYVFFTNHVLIGILAGGIIYLILIFAFQVVPLQLLRDALFRRPKNAPDILVE
jgi:O-antigen/teichoic acid export membrane protein